MLMARKRKQVVLGLPKNTRQRDGSGVARREHSTLIISVCQQPSKSFVELPTCFQPEEAEEEFHRSCLGPSNPYAEPCEKRLTFHSKCVTHRTGHLRSTWPLSQVQVGPCDLGESRADQMSTGESGSQWGRKVYWLNWVCELHSRQAGVKYWVPYFLPSGCKRRKVKRAAEAISPRPLCLFRRLTVLGTDSCQNSLHWRGLKVPWC